jgi:uncharacterized protein (DUF305 family)
MDRGGERMNRASRRPGLALLALTTVAACRTTPAADGAATRPTRAPTTTPAPVAAAATTPAPSPGAGRAAEADVRFMQRMIDHHAQALTMTALVATHSRRAELRALAERIDATQRDEMTLMRRWLASRGQAVPAADAHAGHAAGDHAAAGHAAMPGMLTPDELARLEQAAGPAFDRLFLEGMIRHHEGALTMVQEFFATPGAAQDAEIFRLASDVDADQRAEIRRMRALLAAPTATPMATPMPTPMPTAPVP